MEKEKSLIGYKFFKNNEDGSFDKIRILKVYNTPDKEMATIIDLNTKIMTDINIQDLKSYTPLKGEGMIMISSVKTNNQDDVIVAAYLIDQIQSGKMIPFCVCRQCITDLYYNLLIQDESDMISGMSMNALNVPQGFDYGFMLLSDKVIRTDTIIIYRDDTIESILDLFKDPLGFDRYDTVLKNNYLEHCKTHPEALFRDEDKGWCKTLKKLLVENNFQSDLDQMFGITTVDFVINDYLEETKVREDSEESYLTINEDLRYWLSYLYKLNINRVYVIPYEYDISFDDLKRSRYFIFRDKENKLYIFVYTIDGEYKEAELEEKDKQLDFSTKFRIHYLDKYKQYHPEVANQDDSITSKIIDITGLQK